MNKGYQVVWFKRDLRVHDHAALASAADAGPVVPLYVVETEYWQQPDVSARQWAFARECLAELDAALAELGQPLVIHTGDVVTALGRLHREHGIAALWSHEETGNAWTYARDNRVRAWCLEHSIEWHEPRQHGVVRRLGSRNGWARRWDRQMHGAERKAPSGLPTLSIESERLPDSRELGLADDRCTDRQQGGRSAGLERLTTFLEERGEHYRTDMSSPVTAWDGCSRLSAHLAWGTLSMREIARRTFRREAQLSSLPAATTKYWRGSMQSFAGRLHWHCHFMQKLEDEPSIERSNLHPAYNGLRPTVPDSSKLEAWEAGETGWPFVDACMRSLRATGWINFRMRAMLMAVASYHYWLDWRQPGLHLARQFTDYEPGIHWPQVQMQSGTTGINTPRIYNPVKQGFDQDPAGSFVRRWLPELDAVPDAFIHEPWKWEKAPSVIGRRYPAPLVNHLDAARAARERIWSIRGDRGHRHHANDIFSKHGSRKRRGPRSARSRRPQLPFAFGLEDSE